MYIEIRVQWTSDTSYESSGRCVCICIYACMYIYMYVCFHALIYLVVSYLIIVNYMYYNKYGNLSILITIPYHSDGRYLCKILTTLTYIRTIKNVYTM